MKSLKKVMAIAGITATAVFALSSPAMAGGKHDKIKQHSGNNVGIANGNQVAIPVNLGLNACGNAISVLGGAFAGGSNCKNKF